MAADDRPFRVEADSSEFATGAVLSQLQADERWHPVAYLSKSLSPAERNYEIHDKELLAIVRGLDEWRHFLEGATHRFDILTDHRNLQYFVTARKLNRRQARWSLLLSNFDFRLIHRPGAQSGKPDALSRRVDHGDGSADNSDIVLLKPEYFQVRATQRAEVEVDDDETLLAAIRETEEQDDEVVKAVRELRAGTGVRAGEWAEHDGLVLYRGLVYVPRDEDLRRRIVQAHHDSRVTGHPGRWKTLELVSRNYWWPGISRFVDRYVRGCDACNRVKTFPGTPAGPLMPNPVPTRRWQVVTVDLIGELPQSRGYC